MNLVFHISEDGSELKHTTSRILREINFHAKKPSVEINIPRQLPWIRKHDHSLMLNSDHYLPSKVTMLETP